MWTAIKAFVAFCYQLVVQWIKGQASNDLVLKQRDAELAAANERITALEAAAAKERAERLRVMDEKAAAVRNASDAAELLRNVTHAGKSKADPVPGTSADKSTAR